MPEARKDCESCSGRGILARERRKLADGRDDPTDFRAVELCPACGGGGKVTDWGGKPVPASWRTPGFAADNIVVE